MHYYCAVVDLTCAQCIRDFNESMSIVAFARNCLPIAYARIKVQKIEIHSMAKNKVNLYGLCPILVRMGMRHTEFL